VRARLPLPGYKLKQRSVSLTQPGLTSYRQSQPTTISSTSSGKPEPHAAIGVVASCVLASRRDRWRGSSRSSTRPSRSGGRGATRGAAPPARRTPGGSAPAWRTAAPGMASSGRPPRAARCPRAARWRTAGTGPWRSWPERWGPRPCGGSRARCRGAGA
jgi:hypothetical protein